MQGDRFNIHLKAMPGRVERFTPSTGLEHILPISLDNVNLGDTQQQLVGVLVVDQFLEKIEQEQVQLVVFDA